MIDKMEKALAKVRSKKPLILCLTNFVTVEFVANSLLSIGAAPIMSTCEDETEELVKMASALYVNIGTLDHDFIALAQKAIEIAKDHGRFNRGIFAQIETGNLVIGAIIHHADEGIFNHAKILLALLGRHLDKKHDAAQNRRNGC